MTTASRMSIRLCGLDDFVRAAAFSTWLEEAPAGEVSPALREGSASSAWGRRAGSGRPEPQRHPLGLGAAGVLAQPVGGERGDGLVALGGEQAGGDEDAGR